MSWISLAANRYILRDILQFNRSEVDYQKMRLNVIDAADSRDTLLSGDENHIKNEIKLAEFFLEKYLIENKPPHPAVMSQIFSFAVIASLGEKDYSEIFKLISEAKNYKNPWENSLQLIAKRITNGVNKTHSEYKKLGHISNDKQWFRLVEQAPVSHAFNLAVCPDHPRWSLLCSYVLPLAFLLCQERNMENWKQDLKKLLKWGGPFPEKNGKIVYERVSEKPKATTKITSSNKKTWVGFDAVEIKDNKLFSYYYFDGLRQSPSTSAEKNISFNFLKNIDFDWQLVKDNVSETQWLQINEKINDAVYTLVYDASRFTISGADLTKSANYFNFNLEAKDITQV